MNQKSETETRPSRNAFKSHTRPWKSVLESWTNLENYNTSEERCFLVLLGLTATSSRKCATLNSVAQKTFIFPPVEGAADPKTTNNAAVQENAEQ